MNKLISLVNVKKFIDFRYLSIKIGPDGKELPKAIKKEAIQNRITLIGTDNSVSITDLSNAQNLSDKRELKLVKVQDVDSKTKRPVYKLMTKTEYYEEELTKRKEIKNEKEKFAAKSKKLVTLSSRIAGHDLMTSIKKMLKLLEKRHEIKVIIAGEGNDSIQACEKIFFTIDSNIKPAGRVVQKLSKGNNLKFQLMPLREDSAENSSEKSSSDKTSEPSEPSGPL